MSKVEIDAVEACASAERLTSDRERYIRDNAVAVVNEKDGLIARLRREVARLNKRDQAHKALIGRLRQRLIALGQNPD